MGIVGPSVVMSNIRHIDNAGRVIGVRRGNIGISKSDIVSYFKNHVENISFKKDEKSDEKIG
jgi:hypothetical protein